MASFTRPNANETPYTSASLMRATWVYNHEIQAGVDSDLQKIKGVLTDTYEFQDVLYRMPLTTTEADVIANINQHVASKGSEHLFVFYYPGHGTRNKDPKAKLLLVPGKFKSSKLVYDDIHQALCALRCDVLVILDCCFATNTTSLFQTGMPTTLSHVGKKMVFVGASGASEKTTDRRHATLTYRLCKAIKSLNGWPASLNVILGELNYETSQSRRKRKRDSHIHFAGFDDSSPEERDLFLHRIPGA